MSAPSLRPASVVHAAGLIAVLGFVLTTAPPTSGQQRVAEGVYVDDSFEAAEALARIRRNAAAEQWDAALLDIAEVLERFETKVLEQEPDLYVQLPRIVAREVASWPPAGLQRYRARFEPIAQAAYHQARSERDPAALARLIDRWFPCHTTCDAADTLARWWIDGGAFDRADRLYTHVLAAHPDAAGTGTDLRAHLAICRAFAGRWAAVDTLLAAHPALSDHTVSWAGQPRALGEILTTLRDQPIRAAEPRRSGAPHWPMFGGGADHNRQPDSAELPRTPLWIFEDFDPTTLAKQDGYFQGSSYRAALERGKFLSFQPVVVDGRVVFCDARRVWALDLETGTLLWQFEGVPDDNSDAGWQDRSVPSLFGCAIHGRTVFVELGGRPISYYGYPPSSHASMLVALDLDSGAPRWQVHPQDHVDNPREVQFEGPPLADDTGVAVMVRRRRAFGFEDAYLWKFDPDGALRWQVHLGSAATGGFGYRRPTLGMVTRADGLLYVQTNLGTVVAVDALTGHIDWLSVYDRNTQAAGERWQRSGSNKAFPWQYNPILLMPEDDTTPSALICAPLDTPDVLVLDRTTGRVTGRTPRAELGDLEMLLGMRDRRAYGVGAKAVCWNADDGTVVWEHALTDDVLYGRGAMSSGHLFVPLRSGLAAYPVGGGPALTTSWDPAVAGGNVIPLGDRLLIAGNRHITAYGLRDRVFGRLQERLAARPHDPEPALDLAELAYRSAATHADSASRSADHAVGRAALSTCLDRVGGFAADLPPALRSRFFDDCLRFADHHLAGPPPERRDAVELLELAGQAAPDAERLLRQRLRLAAAHAQLGDVGAELRHYHHVLADRGLRHLPWPDGPTERNVAQACRERIAEIIARDGRAVYAPFDERADTQLAAAIQSRDARRLGQIAEDLPNALAAPRAWLARGEILQSMGQPLPAARAYYMALTRYPDGVGGADTMRSLADCYAAADQPHVAWIWLTRAARLYPDARVRHDGRLMSLTAYRERLGDGGHPPLHPHLGGALQATLNAVVGDRARVLSMPAPTRHSVWTRAFVQDDDELISATLAADDPEWRHPLDGPGPLSVVTSRSDTAVFASPHSLVGLDARNGRERWRHGAPAAALTDPLGDPETVPTWTILTVGDDMVIGARSDGLLRAVDVATGAARWEVPLGAPPLPCLTLCGDHVAIAVSDQDRPHLEIRLCATGARVHRIALPDGGAPLQALATPTGLAVVCGSQHLTVIDPLAGTLVWNRAFPEHLPADTVVAHADGLYAMPGGAEVVKLNLEDGSVMWTAERMAHHGGAARLLIDDEEVYAVAGHRLRSLDPLTGRTLLDVDPPDHDLIDARLADRAIVLYLQNAGGYAASVVERPLRATRQVDVTTALDLGPLAAPNAIQCIDDGILGVVEGRLIGWRTQP